MGKTTLSNRNMKSATNRITSPEGSQSVLKDPLCASETHSLVSKARSNISKNSYNSAPKVKKFTNYFTDSVGNWKIFTEKCHYSNDVKELQKLLHELQYASSHIPYNSPLKPSYNHLMRDVRRKISNIENDFLRSEARFAHKEAQDLSQQYVKKQKAFSKLVEANVAKKMLMQNISDMDMAIQEETNQKQTREELSEGHMEDDPAQDPDYVDGEAMEDPRSDHDIDHHINDPQGDEDIINDIERMAV